MNVELVLKPDPEEAEEDAVVMNAEVKTMFWGLGSWFLWHGDQDRMQCREATKKSASWKESANVWDMGCVSKQVLIQRKKLFVRSAKRIS